jgi:hypothetical protein
MVHFKAFIRRIRHWDDQVHHGPFRRVGMYAIAHRQKFESTPGRFFALETLIGVGFRCLVTLLVAVNASQYSFGKPFD